MNHLVRTLNEVAVEKLCLVWIRFVTVVSWVFVVCSLLGCLVWLCIANLALFPKPVFSAEVCIASLTFGGGGWDLTGVMTLLLRIGSCICRNQWIQLAFKVVSCIDRAKRI